MEGFFKSTPMQHQAEVFEKAKDMPFFAFFWETGTGKTKIGVDLIRWHLNTKKPLLDGMLIICPKAVLYNWQNEFLKHGTQRLKDCSIVLTGERSKRKAILNEKKHSIYITNYESLLDTMIGKDLIECKWSIVILDEAHRIKDHKAKQTKNALKLQAQRRFIMTATPILNSTLDLFTLYKFLDHGLSFGENFFGFRGKYFYDKNASWAHKNNYFPNWQPRKELYPELSAKIFKIADRRLKDECLDLPDKTYEQRFIELTPKQLKHYHDIREELITYLNDKACVAQVALTKVIRLQQITSGFMKMEDHSEVDLDHNRIQALKEIMEEIAPSKAIVWCRFTKDIHNIMDHFSKYNPVALHGATKNDQEVIDTFQNDESCKLIVCQIQKSEGFTLTKASYSIFYSQDYSLKNRIQAEGRNYRKGSEIHNKITYISILAKGTIDEIIEEALMGKNELSETILNIKDKL